MTTEEAIKSLENIVEYWCCHPLEQETAKMAIAALRAQQERENPKLLALDEVAQAYLDICNNDCIGDKSVGIPCCQFYEWPDLDDDEHPCHGKCRLNAYRHKPKEVL